MIWSNFEKHATEPLTKFLPQHLQTSLFLENLLQIVDLTYRNSLLLQ